MMDATRIIWSGAGCPEPCDVLGSPIPRSRNSGRCARCGTIPAMYDVAELISANFVPTKNANRIAAHGGRSYCAACVFAARTLRLRCVSWFASASGVEFWRTRPNRDTAKPDALARLIEPPEPPFVAAIPWYGIAHGGEAHYLRTWWPGESSSDPLIRLQSKHVAIYARVATSRDRYPVQVDDAGEFVLDRVLWMRARIDADTIMAMLVADGVPPIRARSALRDLALPARVSSPAARAWPGVTAPLRPYVQTVWWPLFCDLIPILET